MVMVRFLVFPVIILESLLLSCSGNPYGASPEELATFQGITQTWFEEHWGSPHAKTKKFFGGETWMYDHIPSSQTIIPFVNAPANECRIILEFDQDETVDHVTYAAC